jgi:hypothetical protein
MPAPKQQPAPPAAPEPTPPQVPEDHTTRALAGFEQLAASGDIFASAGSYQLARQIATDLSRSTFVPKAFQGNAPNCLIVVDMALRLHMSPMQIMQSIDVINGMPGWKSQFVIAVITTCGKFASWRYALAGSGMERGCKIVATLKGSDETVEGTEVTMAMAKAEGWIDRAGSKWRTMPEHMLKFRAAAFFGRQYIPERLLGMPAADELGDIIDVTPEKGPAPIGVEGAKEMLKQAQPQK